METNDKIIIYTTSDGITDLEVKLENETVWLSQAQMVTLFGRDQSVISKHINSIFKEGELEKKSTVQDYLTIQDEGKRQVQRTVSYYNLDVIISVGYRVKSLQGTQFRIWANRVLKEFLVKGYAISDRIKIQQYEQLKQTIKLLSNVVQHKELSAGEADGLLRVITDFTYALDTLDKYDHQKLAVERTTQGEKFMANYDNAMQAIQQLKDKFGGGKLFANEKDQSFRSSVATIYQTFDGNDLYPSIEEKAAMFLYLVTKNHSFTDGNKRIAAFLFLWFLENNGILYRADGRKLIENNTLVALTLMIAESHADEKDMIVKVIINLINQNN
jgi:prophage maintenance system killer protein